MCDGFLPRLKRRLVGGSALEQSVGQPGNEDEEQDEAGQLVARIERVGRAIPDVLLTAFGHDHPDRDHDEHETHCDPVKMPCCGTVDEGSLIGSHDVLLGQASCGWRERSLQTDLNRSLQTFMWGSSIKCLGASSG
jgi:hypothetical protein